MALKTPGQHKDAASFRQHWQSVAPDLDCDLALEGAAGPLGRPLETPVKTIGNRWCIHPMEGWDGTADGLPTEPTLRRWAHFGASGAKLLWGGEAFAVRPDGRANPHQLHRGSSAEAEAGLAQLRAAALEAHTASGQSCDDLLLGLQLTHSGRWSRPTAAGPAPHVAFRHPLLDARVGLEGAAGDAAVLSDAELDDLIGDFVATAEMAWRTGYEFVDVKCCHGYLLHELLGAKTRPGPYGGDLAGRTRFFRRTVEAIRAACPGLEVGVRVSIGDVLPFAPGPSEEGRRGRPLDWPSAEPYDYGFAVDRADPRAIDLDEGLAFLRVVEELGLRLVNLTLGSPYTNPHLQRPAAFPPSDGYQPPEDPLHQVATHLRVTRRCKAAFPGLLFVGTGYTYLQDWLPHVAQHELRGGHVDSVGLGRMVLSYHDLPADVLAGRELAPKRICRTLSDCTTAPRNGLRSGCFPLDPYYKATDEAKELRAVKKRLRAEASDQ